MKFKKWIVLVTVGVMILSLCSCKTNTLETNTNDNGDELTLKWVLNSTKREDSEKVWAVYNKKLREIIPGTTIEFEPISGSNYEEKWQLMMAAEETVDIAWSGYAISSFIGEVEKGAYLPLDELIGEYAKDLKEEMPEWFFELGKVAGATYCIPNYQVMSSSPYGLHFPKELADKYLDEEALKQRFMEWTEDPDNEEKGRAFYQVIEDYLAALKDNNLLGKGYDVTSITISPNIKYDSSTITDFFITPDEKIVIRPETVDSKLRYKIANEWFNKGYIHSNILSDNAATGDAYEKGYVIWGHSYYNKDTEMDETISKGVPMKVVPLGEKYYIKNSIPSTSTVIPHTAQNPARSMKVIDLMNTKKGKELYNMLAFGIEGEHYERVSDNRIKTLHYDSSANSESPYGINNWVVGNTLHSWEHQIRSDGYYEYCMSLDDNAEILPTVGFKPDTSRISTEIAQCNSVRDEFKELSYGAFSGWESRYNQYMTKLNEAGCETIRESLQTQLDTWLQKK